jgi:hypothetical protein
MPGLLDAARVGDLATVQRVIREGASVHEENSIGRNALMLAVIFNHAHVVHWLLTSGGARISDTDVNGAPALALAGGCYRYSIAQWLLEEGGARITDFTMLRGKTKSVWDYLRVRTGANGVEFVSLLKVMVLLDDAPLDFIAKLSAQIAQIATQGRRLRALRPSYLEQQQALIETSCPLPAVLQSIVAAYAEPTPEDMWTDWVQWI